MKKLSVLIVFIMIIAIYGAGCNGRAPASDGDASHGNAAEIEFDGAAGYTEKLPLRLEIANFKYGAELPYARYNETDDSSWHARSFAYDAPVYSYVPFNEGSDDLKYKATSVWSDADSDDDCNYFTVYGAKNQSGSGRVIADYLMYIPALGEEAEINEYGMYPKNYENYLDLFDYEKLIVDISSTSSDGKDVEYNILWKNHDGAVKPLYSYAGKSGVRRAAEIDISGIAKADKNKIEFIRFEQVIKEIDVRSTVTTRLFSIRAESAKPAVTRSAKVGGTDVYSEYLGNVLYTKWGAYSASGFYDSEDKKIKIWYGAGLPETSSSDNVYYTECSDLSKGFSKPVRIVTDDSTGYKLIDPSGKLRSHDMQIGYGGDPSVIKVNGVYYMYFSAIEKELFDGKYRHWNKIYVATSADSKVWTVKGIPLDCATGGAAGYGGGSPSAVYKDGEFRLYYYTQAPDRRYPDEPCGLALKTSTDGINFGKAIEIDSSMSAMDVKYIPSLRKWAGTYYAESGQFEAGVSAGVRVAFSDDGISWSFDFSDDKMIAQNFNYPINHNPGFIGDELGHGYETMFLTYGANDLPLTVNGYWFSAAQMDARQLEWSRVTFK